MDKYHRRRADEALNAARACLASQFGGASCAFVAGSIMRGEGTDFSDVDLVVVYPKLEKAWRWSFNASGFPVEAFVHDPETLAYYLEKDSEGGCPIMVNMVATGTIIGPGVDVALALQAKAKQMLAEGPRPLEGAALDTLRYHVGDLADDLRGRPPADEVLGVICQLHPRLIDLMLLGRGAWTGRGKWGPRLLARTDADLAAKLADAFRKASLGDAAALLALAESELARHGSHYFEGYRQEAPADARRVGGG